MNVDGKQRKGVDMLRYQVVLTIIFFLLGLFIIVMLAQYSGKETGKLMDRFENATIDGELSSIENQRGTTIIKIVGDPQKYAFFAKLIELKGKYYDFFQLAAVGDSIQKEGNSRNIRLKKDGKTYVFDLVKD